MRDALPTVDHRTRHGQRSAQAREGFARQAVSFEPDGFNRLHAQAKSQAIHLCASPLTTPRKRHVAARTPKHVYERQCPAYVDARLFESMLELGSLRENRVDSRP